MAGGSITSDSAHNGVAKTHSALVANISSFIIEFGDSCGITWPDVSKMLSILSSRAPAEPDTELVLLHVALLSRIEEYSSVDASTWERFAAEFATAYSVVDRWELKLLGYWNSSPGVRLRLFNYLLESQFDFNCQLKHHIRSQSATQLRKLPLGKDRLGNVYWGNMSPDGQIKVYQENADDDTIEVAATSLDQLKQLKNHLQNHPMYTPGCSEAYLEPFDPTSHDLYASIIRDTWSTNLTTATTNTSGNLQCNAPVVSPVESKTDLVSKLSEDLQLNAPLDGEFSISNPFSVPSISTSVTDSIQAIPTTTSHCSNEAISLASNASNASGLANNLDLTMASIGNQPAMVATKTLDSGEEVDSPLTPAVAIQSSHASSDFAMTHCPTHLQSHEASQVHDHASSPLAYPGGQAIVLATDTNTPSASTVKKYDEKHENFSVANLIGEGFKSHDEDTHSPAKKRGLDEGNEVDVNKKVKLEHVSTIISEPMMHVHGNGSGTDCKTGNDKSELILPAKDESNSKGNSSNEQATESPPSLEPKGMADPAVDTEQKPIVSPTAVEESISSEVDHSDRLLSDHEFSCESDVPDEEPMPFLIARTWATDYLEGCSKACQRCQMDDHPEWLLLCDQCDVAWHLTCLRPVLLAVPEGQWLCPDCQHLNLLEKMTESIQQYETAMKKRVADDKRKERLAFVSLSLSNMIPSSSGAGTSSQARSKPAQPRSCPKRRRTRQHDSSASDSSSSSAVNDDDDDDDDDGGGGATSSSSSSSTSRSTSSASASESGRARVSSRRRRAARKVNYSSREFDEMIKSALAEEESYVKGEGNRGKGKDINNILRVNEDSKSSEDRVQSRGKDMATVIKASKQPDDDGGESDLKAGGNEAPKKPKDDEAADQDEDEEDDEDEEEEEEDPVKEGKAPKALKMLINKDVGRKRKKKKLSDLAMSDDEDEDQDDDSGSDFILSQEEDSDEEEEDLDVDEVQEEDEVTNELDVTAKQEEPKTHKAAETGKKNKKKKKKKSRQKSEEDSSGEEYIPKRRSSRYSRSTFDDDFVVSGSESEEDKPIALKRSGYREDEDSESDSEESISFFRRRRGQKKRGAAAGRGRDAGRGRGRGSRGRVRARRDERDEPDAPSEDSDFETKIGKKTKKKLEEEGRNRQTRGKKISYNIEDFEDSDDEEERRRKAAMVTSQAFKKKNKLDKSDTEDEGDFHFDEAKDDSESEKDSDDLD